MENCGKLRSSPAVKVLAASLMVLATLQLPALAGLTAQQLTMALKKCRVLGADAEMGAELHQADKEVIITANCNPKATDRDCKIDAVLIARKLTELDPGAFAKVTVLFYERSNDNNFRKVTVREGEIKAFATHQISQDTLLAEIETQKGFVDPLAKYRLQSYAQISRSLSALPGQELDARKQMLARILALKEKNVPVHYLLARFFQMEDKVRRGDDSGASQILSGLTCSLEREEANNKDSETASGESSGHNAAVSADRQSPAPGLLFPRRLRLAQKIAELKETGRDVSAYERLEREIEFLANTGNRPVLLARIRWAEQQLGLLSPSDPVNSARSSFEQAK